MSGASPHLGPKTVAVKWIYPILFPESDPVIAADGTVYFAADETLYALDATGTKK